MVLGGLLAMSDEGMLVWIGLGLCVRESVAEFLCCVVDLVGYDFFIVSEVL